MKFVSSLAQFQRGRDLEERAIGLQQRTNLRRWKGTQILTSYKNTLRNSCGEDGMVSFTRMAVLDGWWRTLQNNIHFKYPEMGVLPYTCMCRGIGYGFGGYRFASVSIVFLLWSLDRICKLYRLKLQFVNGQLNKKQIPLKLSTKWFYWDLCFTSCG